MFVNNLVNGNLYIDGQSFFGKFKEITLPEPKATYGGFEALGQVFKLELITGMDLLTANIKMNSAYADPLTKIANPYGVHRFQLRSNLETYTGSALTGQNAYVCQMTGTFKKNQGGMFKSKNMVELETEVNVTYCKVTIAGEPNPIYELDVMNNIFLVDGADILAQYRANLGV